MNLLLVCKGQVMEKRAEASLATHACPVLFGVCLMLNFFLNCQHWLSPFFKLTGWCWLCPWPKVFCSDNSWSVLRKVKSSNCTQQLITLDLAIAKSFLFKTLRNHSLPFNLAHFVCPPPPFSLEHTQLPIAYLPMHLATSTLHSQTG